jgi:hypothetical protein
MRTADTAMAERLEGDITGILAKNLFDDSLGVV